jgi:hypothetical protein
MKTITPTPTPTTFFLPADDLRAAFQCIGTEQTRYYLGGVLIEADKLIALDGHQMLTIDLPDGCHVGAECFTQGMDAPRMPGATGTPQGAGFILSCDATDKAFKSNSKVGDLWVYGDIETGILQFVINHGKGGEMSRTGVLEFERIDGTFPEWRRVVAKGDGGTTSLCYDPAVLAKLIKAADVIDKGHHIRLTGGDGAGSPIRVDFVASARLRGTLMPTRWTGA